MERVDNEPDDIIGLRNITYGNLRYESPFTDLGSNNGGYEASWQGPAMTGITYKVRYSNSATSIKSSGWASATDGGTVTSPYPTSNGSAWYLSPNMAKQSNFSVAVRPVMPVYTTTGNGVNPSYIFTKYSLGLSTGDAITAHDIGGNTALNVSSSAILGVQPRKIWWRFEPIITTTWSTPYTISNITASGGTCTTNLSVDHGIAIGTPFEVLGTTYTILGSSQAKVFVVASTPTATSFTFTCTGVNNGVYQGDYVPVASDNYHMAIMTYPGVIVNATGNGAYTSGGTIESADDTHGFSEITWEPYSPGAEDTGSQGSSQELSGFGGRVYTKGRVRL